MSKFQQRHYEAIAEVLQKVQGDLNTGIVSDVGSMWAITNELSRMFASDNELFQSARFERACQPGANVKARVR